MIQSGFYPDMPDSEYHGLPGYSKTVLCAPTPFDYWANRIYTGPRPEEKEKDSYLQGRLVHCMILEKPEVANRFVKNIGLHPDGDNKPLKRGSKAYVAWAEANPGKTLITPRMWDECVRMETMALKNPLVSRLLSSPGWAESSFISRCPETGELIRCRPDYQHKEGRKLTIDLKTCGDFKASPHKFPWDAYQFHYHVSAAFTLDIIEQITGQVPEEYLYIVVEKAWPHRTGVWKTTRQGLETGRNYYRKRLRLLNLCKQSGYYPAYTAGGKNKVNPFKLFEFVEDI